MWLVGRLMAGSDPSFRADEFRAAIREAMRMGAPNHQARRCTFRWSPQRTWAQADDGGRPYHWGTPPSSETTRPDVVLNEVAVELGGGSEHGTGAGVLDVARATLTILDEDWDRVEGADTVLLGGNTYTVTFVEPPQGLFDVDVYTVHLEARDES